MLRIIAVIIIPLLCSACLFPTKPTRGLEHFNDEAPDVGENAPNFTLKNLNGKEVSLNSLIGEKPIVLQLGSHTCPVYRYRRFSMRQLHAEYRDDAHFLMIYTLEAHPVGSNSPYADREWVSLWNRIPGVLIPQPDNYEERLTVASDSQSKLSKYYQYPYLVDNINNSVWKSYGSASSPAFVIDQSGKIALKQVWVNPKEIAKTLDKLIDIEPTSSLTQ